ncbi:MAG: hypothetical protein WBC22_06670, partial [Sedimentisphaerales bacterium]
VLATLWLTTCGAPQYPLPAGGLGLSAGKHEGILTDFQTKVKKKMTKKALFLKNPKFTTIVFGPERSYN